MCASIWILLYVLYHDRDIHSCLISKTRLRNIVPSLYLRLQTFHALLHTHVLYLYIYKSQHHSQLYRKRGITGMNTELIPIKYTPTLRCFSPHGIPKQWWIQGGARWRAPPLPLLLPLSVCLVHCIMNVEWSGKPWIGPVHRMIVSTIGPKWWMCLANNLLAVQITHTVQLFE